MDLDQYLERIGYRESRAVDADTLRALQVAHLLTVPFENISIHADEPIVLDEAALFDKVVRRRRGGFCYELNGLFAGLLQRLGFEVTKLSARVARKDGSYSPALDHMALMVTLSDCRLVDVGFGDTFREPLLLGSAVVQTQIGRGYRIDSDGETMTLMERKDGGDWTPQYRFTRQAFDFDDFVPRCTFHQTSPESHFHRGRICSRATTDGRLTLNESLLITTTFSGGRAERTLGSQEEVAEVLATHFGIVM